MSENVTPSSTHKTDLASRLNTTHQSVEIKIHSEMRGHICNDIPDFLSLFLPQDEPLVATIDNAIRAEGGPITKDGKWSDLRPKPSVVWRAERANNR
jgi:hypothetical protein